MRRPDNDDLVWDIMLGILEAALVVGVIGASIRDLPVVRRLARLRRAEVIPARSDAA
jgi:hypothetical protein